MPLELNTVQVQEQKLVQQQRLTALQILQIHMLEMPLAQIEQAVKSELCDNPALEAEYQEPEYSEEAYEPDENGDSADEQERLFRRTTQIEAPLYMTVALQKYIAFGADEKAVWNKYKVILTGIVLSIIYLIIQYSIAGAIAKKNPFKCLWNMLPAYLTAFSICSSSAVIPVTSKCTRKNGVSEDIVDFTIPLCSTVHMCGSTIKLAASAIAVAYISGMDIPFSVYASFVMMQGIAAVAAPGVMGGVLMASVGLLESIMGFSPDQTALVMTIYLALDGYGPACNVTGDGAIALVIDRFFGKSQQKSLSLESSE